MKFLLRTKHTLENMKEKFKIYSLRESIRRLVISYSAAPYLIAGPVNMDTHGMSHQKSETSSGRPYTVISIYHFMP